MAPKKSDADDKAPAAASATEDGPSTNLLANTKNPGDDSDLNNDGYVGVDPIYQNAANDTDKPL